MRTLLMVCATSATLLAGGVGLPTTANAMPRAPVAAPRLVDNVDYSCGEVRACTRFACGWTNVCGWRPETDYGPYTSTRPHRGWRRSHRRYR